MNALEAREVAYFMTLADELHFGRAAQRLGIAQPPLSRAILRLERRMGVTLFHRTTRNVSLTAAGQVFVIECRKVLKAMDNAVKRTQEAQRLTVAIRPGAGPGVLSSLLAEYQERFASSPPTVLFTYDELASLRADAADVAIMCATEGLAGMQFVDLGLERPVALLPMGHRLAGRADVTIDELRELDGYVADLPHEGLDAIVDRVALGQIVVVVGESVTERLGSSVRTVPVLGFPVTKLVMAWPVGTKHGAREQLVEVALSLSRASSCPGTLVPG
jgi:DNA-binding transcriptional LysR family regulator